MNSHPSTTVRASKLALSLFVAALLVVLAWPFGPGEADGSVPPNIDRIDVYASFVTEDGLMIVSYDYFNFYEEVTRFTIMKFGSSRWRCNSRLPGDAFPAVEIQGNDSITLEGSFDSSEFGWCDSNAPEEISFSFDLEAATVLLERSSAITTVVKGEYPYVGGPNNYKQNTWRGFDVTVEGSANGAQVISTGLVLLEWTSRVIDSNS